MFRRVSEKALSLDVEGKQHHFPTVADFEYSLSGRTGLHLNRIMSILSQQSETLLRDVGSVRKVSDRLSQFLGNTTVESPNISAFMRGLEPSLISQDHGWRNLFGALAHYDSSADPYKRVAISKYNQYLAVREEVTRSIYARRQDDGETLESSAADVSGPLGAAATADLAASHGTDFDRLPKGEAVEVAVPPGHSVPVVLVKHRCELRGGSPPTFVDSQGQATALGQGRHIVGRDARGDITVPTVRRDISRRHLIIDVVEPDLIQLTDISSLGTFVPSACLDKTGG